MKKKALIINQIKENYVFIAILFAATFLRFYKLDFQSLWMDELYTMNVASPNHGFVEMIKDVTFRESFPYLYFIIVKTFFLLFGHYSIVARIPSAIFGVLCVWMIYKLGKELVSKKVGLIAAILITFNQYSIYNSQDARAYSFYLFFVILSYYQLNRFIQNPSKSSAIKYGISAGLLLNTNFFAISNVLAQGFLLLILKIIFINEKKIRLQNIKLLMLTISITFIFFIPNIYKFYLTTQFFSDWIPAPTNGGVTIMIKEMVCDSEFVLFLSGILLMFYFLNAFKYSTNDNAFISKLDKKVLVFIVLISWIVFPLLLVVIKSYMSSPLYVTRYLYSILPAILILFAIAINEINNSIIKYCFLFLLLFSLLFDMVEVKKYYNYPCKAQFREASKVVIANKIKTETVYTSQKYWFDYYFQNGGTNISITEIEFESIIEKMIQNPQEIKSFWYIDAFGKTYSPSEKAKEFINNNFFIDKNFEGFQAWAKHFVLLKDVSSAIEIKNFKNIEQNNGEPFMYNVEKFVTVNNVVSVIGWAYFNNQLSQNTEINILLIKDNKPIKFLIQKNNRPDVTSYFKNKFNVDSSGFDCKIDLANVESGIYKIGLYLKDLSTNKESLIIYDKTVQK